MTLLEVVKKLNRKSKCLKFIAQIRWTDGIMCPRCAHKVIHRITTRHKFECSNCRYQFNAIAGTPLSKTYIPLPKWMLAIYLFCSSEGKVRAAELVRVLDLPYKTAWHMHKKIQKESKNFEFEKLAGIV